MIVLAGLPAGGMGNVGGVIGNSGNAGGPDRRGLMRLRVSPSGKNGGVE